MLDPSFMFSEMTLINYGPHLFKTQSREQYEHS